MLYLILPEQKKILKKEYSLRFATVALCLLCTVLILWLATLIPSLALVQVEKKNFESRGNAMAQIPPLENGDSIEDYVRNINQKIKLLEAPEVVVSDLIKEVVSRQIRSVKINTMEFMIANPDDPHINLIGIANNRESLVEFSNALETSEYFSSVDVPFSNFTFSSDIPFSIKISLNKNKDE